MTTVLCFGDSLTWGDNPDGSGRHRRDDRWPVVLAGALKGVEVISEGLNGRTTAWAFLDGGPADRNGATALPICLHSHSPLDLVIVMLGTNDVINLRHDAYLTALGIARLAEIVAQHPYPIGATRPNLLIVAPPPINVCPWAGEAEVRQSEALAAAYAEVAQDFGAAFFDAGTLGRASERDGVHLDPAMSRALGAALAPIVEDLIGREGHSSG